MSDPSVSDLAAVLNLAAPVLTPELGGDGFYVGDTDHDGILDAGETWSFFNVGDLDQNGTQDLGETFEFRNSGDTNLDVYGHVGDGRINVGETWHYTASHTVTQAEMDAGGSITNTASVTTAEGATAQGSAPVTVEQRPELVIEKTGAWVDGADGDGFADPDELVNYTITVMNTGNVTLHDVTVTDPSATLVRGADVIGNDDASFDVGEQWSFTGSHAITQDEIDAGNAHNEATASALGPQDQPASDSDDNDAALPQNPHLTLMKTGTFVDGGSEPNGYADPGETVHYTFSIENDGNVTLSSLLLSDLLGLELIGPNGDDDFDGLLDVGETWTFEGDYGLTAADIAAGTVHNEATASAQGPQAQPVSDDASADTALPPPPPAALMTLDKSDVQGTHFVDFERERKRRHRRRHQRRPHPVHHPTRERQRRRLDRRRGRRPAARRAARPSGRRRCQRHPRPRRGFGLVAELLHHRGRCDELEQRRRGPQRRDRDGARSDEQCRDRDGRMGPVLPIRLAVGPRLAHCRGTRLRHRRNGGPPAAVLPCGPALPVSAPGGAASSSRRGRPAACG